MRADVQKWLSPVNVQDDLYRHQRDCMTDSRNWALKMPDVQDFLNSGTSEILKIGGAPGSGKTTLTAFLIGYIMRTTQMMCFTSYAKELKRRRVAHFKS
jgi:ABC-type Mn2+/Zn2+ transport system ATPase subunit